MGILYVVLVISILLIIVEVLAIALKITGLDMDKARFQVISIITGTGFTTKEAELITQHPTRRQIAEILMLISYVGTATLIGLIMGIVNLMTKEEGMYSLIVVIGIAILILFLTRNRWVISRMEKYIERQLLIQMERNKKYKTVEEALKLNDEFGIAEFVLEENNNLVDRALENSGLKEKYIQVLNVDRGSHMVHFPSSKFVFQQGDKIVLYGQLDNIKELVLKQANENLNT
ncbi:TrkA C-terminal domain-containing protein [Marinisporobacter balticus]|uniref:TrkA family protein n=1 Tax=Marinisporobacter balticus TaxID=2018667 RepID=A0A4R2L5X0_9FIRM|nr:TrkA C-terminal domain-containing protein [Marinisporobacter balticus]TCO79449.1 TrkA family protein [Marinisporobacter balticus]